MRRAEVQPASAVHGLFVTFGLVFAAFFPFFAIYLRARGLRPDEIGLVIAVMALARIVANPIFGHFADTRIGRLAALQIGVVGAALAAVAMNLVDAPGAIAAAAFFVAGFNSTAPNVDAIALVYLGDERMSNYGQIRSWESLSYAAACLVFGLTLQLANVRWAMPLFALSNLLVLGWSSTLRRDRPVRDGSTHGRLGAVGAVFREAPRFWGFLVAVLLVWTGFNATWNFISLKITSEGGGPLLIGMGAALGGLIEVPVMRTSPRLQRRWGLRRVYVVGCCIYATGFLLWGLMTNPVIVSFLTVFEGAAFGLLFTSGVVIIGRLLPSFLYSTGNSVAAMVGFGVGPILGAGIGGFVYQHAGTVALYTGASVVTLVGAAVAWVALSTPQLSEPQAAGEPVE